MGHFESNEGLPESNAGPSQSNEKVGILIFINQYVLNHSVPGPTVTEKAMICNDT